MTDTRRDGGPATDSRFNRHSHLWNDMPIEERERLMPHMLETHILDLHLSFRNWQPKAYLAGIAVLYALCVWAAVEIAS